MLDVCLALYFVTCAVVLLHVPAMFVTVGKMMLKCGVMMHCSRS